MSVLTIVVLVVVVVVVLALAAGAVLVVPGRVRRRRLRGQLTPLSTESRAVYRREWAAVQERFVDDPAESVAAADRLIADLLGELGYPGDGFDERADSLAVAHGAVAATYRRAHEVLGDSREGVDSRGGVDLRGGVDSRGGAEERGDVGGRSGVEERLAAGERSAVDTDELRRALLDYRAVFETVAGEPQPTRLPDTSAA